MFGPIGVPELIVIFLVALLIFGPRKLPEIGKNIGKGLSEFKRASDDLKRTIEQEMEQGKNEVAGVQHQLESVQGTVAKTLSTADEPAAAAPPDPRPIHPS
jgi:TatA/E family protein of Tat protein translocase